MADSIFPKEVEELKALCDDTKETCELVRLIAANVVAKGVKSKQMELAKVIDLLPPGALEPTGT